MGVMGWPGLEKRTNEFSKSATADELLMVYVKEGSARLTEGEESGEVMAGQMVMISDGEVKWSDVTELTLISTTAPLADVTDDDEEPSAAVVTITADDDPVKDLTFKEAGLLLGGGIVAGGLLSVGVKLFTSS